MRQDDRAAAIALDYVDNDRKSDRHQIEFWLVTTMVPICRQATDTRLALRHLRIRHRRDQSPAEITSFLDGMLSFALIAMRSFSSASGIPPHCWA